MYSFSIMSKLLWTPSKDIVKEANITKFIQFVNTRYSLKLQDYNELYQWSVDEISDFWESIWEFTGIISSRKATSIVENLERFPPHTKWFSDAKLNFAENLLRYDDDKIAIISKRETGKPLRITYKELRSKVAQLSTALREMGVVSGDRVVAYMPTMTETIVVLLATTSIGATFASCGAELGADAALDRLGQIKPKVLFAVDAYPYKGKKFDLLTKTKSVSNNIPTLEKVVIYPYMDENLNIEDISNAVNYLNFINVETPKLLFEQLPFEHPLYIMFSSGTTGKPKCMVQSAGGILINHLKELILHTDLKREDKLFYISSPSWMMFTWMTTSLAVGSTLVLYDGNPLHPDWGAVWEYIDNEDITVFGCSASYLHYLKSIGAKPGKDFNLKYLREISQTGSALSDEGFEFVYTDIKSDLHFNSISGGTDINGCFAIGSPTLPVYSGELQARALGMRVSALDLDGNPSFDTQGELVCELPSPSMPIYFWDDEGNKKYNSAYFDYYSDRRIWRHGDYIEIKSKTGGVTFYGRSDSVLKPSGVRIGTAEIYNVVEQLDEVLDSLAIGQQYKNDQRIILFVQLQEGVNYNEELEKKIKSELRTKASPRHVPALLIITPDIPYTFSGKKVESAVTNILHGRDVSNRGAMRNPECLDFYEKIRKELDQ